MHETIHRYLKKKNEKGNEEREREETSMKKFKKLLVGLLAGAMMLGSMSATAFAADATTTTKMPTIDENRTGSLTIHKYEYNGTDAANKDTGSEADTANKATGSEADTVPEGAKELSGITFEITKAYGLDSFYKTDSIKLPTVDEAKAEIEKNKTSAREGTTGTNGEIKFKDLELGIYLVHESDSSAQPQITGKVADFLVSIPMTNKDGDDWLYDVHVFPKNSSTYAGVTLQKKGKIGSAEATALKGATFVLQKEGIDGKWTTITKNNKGAAVGTNGVLTTGADGKITVSDLAPGTYRFVEIGVPSNTGYIMNGRDTKEFEITTAGEVKIGNDVVNTNQKPIEVTNEKPDMTKQVQKRNNTWGQDADYNVGDMVPYKITVDVPSNITSLKEFTLTDTPTNLEDDIDSVAVKDGETSLTKDTNYTISKDTTNGKGFKISFTTTTMADYAGKQLVITYNAELLSSAVTPTDVNLNTAKLEYSNTILPDKDDGSNPNKPGEPGKDSIEDNAIVYTFSVKIDKRANSATGDPLSGVIFDLYKYAGTESNPTEAELKANGTRIANGLKTGTDGTITKSGLANGTYYLVETKTVKGYNLLKAPVKVELSIAYTTTTETEHYTTKNGVKTLVKHEVKTTTSTVTHTETIINKKGFTLPTTGGMGTIAITALGVALAFAGVLIIGASRKKTVK